MFAKLQLVWALVVFITATPLFASLRPETGAFVFQNYSAKAYNANPQNWTIAEDSRGVMYFGNNDGILEFDGVFWRLIHVTYGNSVRSLAVDARGRVYVGGRGVFGYLAPDEHGDTQFVPIKVPKADQDFLDVWNVLPTSSGVYFGTRFKIFFYSNSGELKVWRASAHFGRIFTAYGELYATTSDQGLRRLQKDDFVAGPTGDSDLLHGGVAFAPGEQPIIASARGLFNFAISEITPFNNAASSYLLQSNVFCITQLSGGDVAVGTKSGGLVLLSRQGALERVIRKESGLASDWVTSVYEDRQHGIWVTTNSGISRFVRGLSTFGEAQGLHGNALFETRVGNSMYVATARGAFKMRAVDGAEPAFEEIKDLHEQVVALAAHGNEIFAGGDRGLYNITSGTARKLSAPDSGIIYDICFSRRDPNVMYTAGLGGVRKWRSLGSTWKSEEPVGVKGQEFITAVEDSDGTVWSTTNLAIWHIDFSQDSPRVQQFTTADGIASGLKYAYWFRGHAVIATAKGLLRFSENAGRLEPDTELGPQYSDGSKSVSIVRETPSGNVWITGKGYDAYLQKDSAGFRTYPSPLIQTGADELWSIFLDPDGTCWATDPSGMLIRLENLDLRVINQELPTLLRRVSVIGHNDSLFNGDSSPDPITLQHRDNGLRFEFAAPYYEAPTALEYQFLLEGDEKKWSNWTTETHKEYTNLFEGPYKFHVRARDPHGRQGREVVFPFRVIPPFYRTLWAYAIYVFVFLFAGWLILRWRLNALEAKNRWLEGVVEERTVEVRKERDQNEALLLNILPKPVATELRANGTVKPTTFEDATVCFSDFVGFTLSSEKLSAETLITALNEYFTAFDEIIGRYGLEKLKTIGDAYMFAGGLPNLRPSHAVDAVLAALEMAEVVNRLTRPDQGVNWKIRLGLYSGPVVSGVVGVRKFAFDIWGNTVNFAARMESAGKPGRVNVSETTFQKIERFIACEPRGPVAIKEGRQMEMYFAVSPKLDLLRGPLVDGVPEAFLAEYEKAFGYPPKGFPTPSTLDQLLNSRMAVPGDSK